MNRLYLFAMLAGTRIAVETREVEAVVKLTDISPVPSAGAHVAGLSALRSRVLTII
ncbi:MAG TPA: chemotaxis protein CheW, partial [Sphingobium sp.]|nr:chemotaxis protein CheW [Sphingobium sp.]